MKQLLIDIEAHMRAMWKSGALPASCWPIELAQRLTTVIHQEPALQHTDQERAEFEAWLNPEYSRELDGMDCYIDGVVYSMFSAWQAARRAPVVPQGWKLVPEESTDAMARAFRADDAPYYFAMTTIRCNDFAERWRAVIAAAPQPPEAAAVQMPEPVLYVSPGQLANHTDLEYPDSGRYIPARKTQAGNFTCGLLTEHQVRQLLAAHGIK